MVVSTSPFPSFLDARGVSDRAKYAAELAVEEIGTNIIKYGTKRQRGSAFELTVEVDDDLSVVLRFDDEGPSFDPTAHVETEPPDELG